MLKPNDDAPTCPDTFLKDSREIPLNLHLRIAKRRARAAGLGDQVPACTGNEAVSSEIESIMEALERIHLKPDFLPARFLRDGSHRASAVCRITGPRCAGTAFLIARGLLLTNNHVLGTADFAARCKAEFDFEDGKTAIGVSIRPDKVFITSRALDYTIVACDDTPLTEIAPIRLKRDPTLVAERERVNIIQHPKARKKEVAIHENRVEKRLDRVIRYRTDTDRGSSGAPVFNDQWELVALHHAGCDLPNNEALNEGVLISAIVDDLNLKLNDKQFSASAKLVVPHLENVSPLLGFFQLSGVLNDPGDQSVGAYAGDRRFTDIGFWACNQPNDAPSNDWIHAAADAIKTLNLDLLGVTGIRREALDRLVVEAGQHSKALDYVATSTQGEASLAVLFDTDSTHAERLDPTLDGFDDVVDGQRVFPHTPLVVKFKVTEIDGDSTEFIVVGIRLCDTPGATGRRCRQLASSTLTQLIDRLRQEHELPVLLGGDFHQEVSANVLGAIEQKHDLVFATTREATGSSLVVGLNKQIEDIVTTRDQQVVNIDGGETGVTRLDQSLPPLDSRVSDDVPVVFRIIMQQLERSHQDQPSEPPPEPSGDPDFPQGTHVVRVPRGTKEIRIQFE